MLFKVLSFIVLKVWENIVPLEFLFSQYKLNFFVLFVFSPKKPKKCQKCTFYSKTLNSEGTFT